MKPERRGSWYLLTGVILGVALGLLYSWLISPVKYVDAPPYALRADYKDEYRVLVASAYLYNHDLLRAEGRLVQLKEDNSVHILALQAQQAHAEGHPIEEVQALNSLSLALGGVATPASTGLPPDPMFTLGPPTSAASPTPVMSEPTASQDEIATPIPAGGAESVQIATITALLPYTATPSTTPGGPFVLQETRLLCNNNQLSPMIEVDFSDAAGQPFPNVEVFITWDGGEDHFFTGLQPELGLGYGDFVMTPDIVYSVHLSDGGQMVNELTAAQCFVDNGSSYWGSWYLRFVQQ